MRTPSQAIVLFVAGFCVRFDGKRDEFGDPPGGRCAADFDGHFPEDGVEEVAFGAGESGVFCAAGCLGRFGDVMYGGSSCSDEIGKVVEVGKRD
jgi:hypothetical protein